MCTVISFHNRIWVVRNQHLFVYWNYLFLGLQIKFWHISSNMSSTNLEPWGGGTINQTTFKISLIAEWEISRTEILLKWWSNLFPHSLPIIRSCYDLYLQIMEAIPSTSSRLKESRCTKSRCLFTSTCGRSFRFLQL